MGSLLVAASCNLIVDDWEVGAGGSTSSAGGATAGGTSTGAAGGAGGGGGSWVSAEPLQFAPLGADPIADGIRVWREGHFRIDADADSSWQWARWFYLPSDPDEQMPLGPVIYDGSVETPHYRTMCLWTAIRGHGSDTAGAEGYSPRSCRLTPGDTNPDFVDLPTFDESALPVWFTLGGEVDDGWGGNTTFRTRVFGSGRVWTWTHFVNTSPSPPVYDNAEIIFGLIGVKADEFFVPLAGEEGLFPMKRGGGALLAVDTGRLLPESPGPTPGAVWEAESVGLMSDGVAGTWEVNVDIPSQTVLEIPFAFFLGPSVSLDAERVARAADLRSPGLEIASGASTLYSMWGGLDPETGTYTLDADPGVTNLSFWLAALDVSAEPLTRFEPAFEIRSWSWPTWTLRLGDEVLATSSGQGPSVLAVQSGTTFLFQYLGTIAPEGAEPDRTFTLSVD
jgi:hypothetical protein